MKGSKPDRKKFNILILEQEKKKATYLDAYSLTEILIVLAIIGILIMMVLPNQTSVVAQARSLEAQNMLKHLHGLQKSYFYRFSKQIILR